MDQFVKTLGEVFFIFKNALREGYVPIIFMMSFVAVILLIAFHFDYKRRQRLAKLRQMLDENEEYRRLAAETRTNLVKMEGIVVTTLSKMPAREKRQLARAYRLDGSEVRWGLREIMNI